MKTNVIRLSAAFLAVSCSLLLASSQNLGAAQSNKITLNDADIRSVAEIISNRTGKNFIVDSSVNAKLNFISPAGVNTIDLYQQFINMLDVEGLITENHGNTIYILPKSKKQVLKKDDNFKYLTVSLKYVSADAIRDNLQSFASSSGITLLSLESSNSIVLSGKPESVDNFKGIVSSLDKPTGYKSETFYLLNADASEVAETMKAALTDGARLAPNERTNSIVFSGDESQRSVIRSALEGLDIEKTIANQNLVVKLRYAKSESLAETLNKLSVNKGAVSVADTANNSIIVSGTKAQQASVQQIIKALDRRKPQILVEAIIADVSQDLTDKLGSALVTNGVSSGLSSNFGGLESVAGIYGAIQSKTAASVPTGLVLAGRDGALDLVFNALRSDADTNIISTPSLVTLDNEEAQILVGQEVPFLTSKGVDATGATVTNIERKDVGIKFKITPQIDGNSTVKLAITEEVSNISSSAVASDIITNKREITTNVMVNDGQIVVLGGLVEDQIRENADKVPVLGDIPVLGNLFKSKTGRTSKTNLMLFIHPVILPDPDSANAYTRQKHQAIAHRFTPSAPSPDQTPVQPELTPASQPGQPKKQKDCHSDDLICQMY